MEGYWSVVKNLVLHKLFQYHCQDERNGNKKKALEVQWPARFYNGLLDSTSFIAHIR